MKLQSDNLYHVYNQGNNRQVIFPTTEDYLIFLRITRKCILPFADIIAFSLMPNHFHFMIYADQRCSQLIKLGGIYIDPITNGLRKLLSGYARIYNSRYQQTGSIFRQKTKAKCLSEIDFTPSHPLNNHDYYFNCFNYIHQNPLRAGLVTKMEDWDFSSFKDYAGVRNGTLCNKELAVKYCSYHLESFLRTSYKVIPEEIIKKFF